MGAINFKTSDIITLCIEPYDFEEFKKTCYDGEEVSDDFIFEDIYTIYKESSEQAQSLIDDFYYEYYSIKIDWGYYESFSINITPSNYIYFDDEEERQETLDALAHLKTLLIGLVDIGLVACGPGWCTKYYSDKETLEMIDKAINEEQEKLENIPTWEEYERSKRA